MQKAYYLYAIVFSHGGTEVGDANRGEVESLLKQAIKLDPGRQKLTINLGYYMRIAIAIKLQLTN